MANKFREYKMNKKILALAIPNIVSNISIPLVTTVDTILMGHLSSSHLAALGIVGMIFLFLYGTINFLRRGTTGITAQAFGRDDKALFSKTLYRALFIALGLSLMLLLFQDFIGKLSFYLMNVDLKYEVYAQSYFSIRIYTAPAVFMLYVLIGWFFGMQNAIYPLLITLLINLLNILFSYYFVNVLHLGIEGAAYGTVISQYSGLILAFIFLLKYKNKLYWFPLGEIFKLNELLIFLRINRDIFIRTILLTFSFAFFYAQASKNGEETLTVMILLLQFIVWFAYTIDGFANASESLVGRYYGAKDWSNFAKVIKYTFMWGMGLTVIYMLVYFFFGMTILHLYTNQQGLIERTLFFLPYVSLMPILSFMAYLWDGIFVGMTAVKALRNITIISSLFFITVFYLFKDANFTYALWFSFMNFFFMRGLLQSFLFWREGKGLK